jgi:hypothetical protein
MSHIRVTIAVAHSTRGAAEFAASHQAPDES